MCEFYGNCIYAAFMCFFVPCISRRGPLHTQEVQNQAEVPRSAKPKTKSRKRSSVPKTEHFQQRVSAWQVHQDLLKTLDQPLNQHQQAALFRLQMAFLPTRDHLSPETFAPVIADLDTVLFKGRLKDNIIIEWAEMTVTRRSMLRGISLPYDINRSGISKVRIRLNEAMFRLDPKEEIWGTVVHELLHAYLDLESNWRGLTKPHHGTLFERSCRALAGRLAIEGFEAKHVV
jgi:hypothetical protein